MKIKRSLKEFTFQEEQTYWVKRTQQLTNYSTPKAYAFVWIVLARFKKYWV